MKKTKIWFGLLSFLALGACEISEIESKKNDCEYYDYSSSSLYQTALLDEETELVLHNKMLFYMSTILSEMSLNSNYASELLDKDNYDGADELKLEWLMENVPGFSSDFESKLYQLSSCVDTALSYDQFLQNLKMDGDEYYPTIYFLNRLNSTNNSSAFFALGVESETDEHIPAYKVNLELQDSVLEVLISEKDTANIYPVLISTTGWEDDTLEENLIIKPSNINSVKSNTNWIIDEYKASFRYERSGKSEYCQEVRNVFSAYYGDKSLTQTYRIKDLNSNEIGVLFTQDITCVMLNTTPEGTYNVTYERDFYAGKKYITVNPTWYLTNAQSNIANYPILAVGCKMVNKNEYYQRFALATFNQVNCNVVEKGLIKIKF